MATHEIPVVRLNRRGRKRKGGYRKANGRLEINVDIRGVVLAQPHRRWLSVDRRLDQKAESPLGSLNLTGALSDAEHEAGKRFAKVVARYRVVLSSWDPCMKPTPGTAYTELTGEEARKRKNAYDDMFEAIDNQKAQYAVSRVCVYSEPCPDGYFVHLKAGLGTLVRHFGI